MSMIFCATPADLIDEACTNGRFGRRSRLGHEAIENFQKGIDDGLAERIGGFSDLLVGHVTGGECEIATLVSNDGARSSIAHWAKSLRLSMDIVSIADSSVIYDFFSV